MRATFAGFGAAASLLAGAVMALVVVSAVVAVRGWPGMGEAPGGQEVVLLADAPGVRAGDERSGRNRAGIVLPRRGAAAAGRTGGRPAASGSAPGARRPPTDRRRSPARTGPAALAAPQTASGIAPAQSRRANPLGDVGQVVGDGVRRVGGATGQAVRPVAPAVGDIVQDTGATAGGAVEDATGALGDALP